MKYLISVFLFPLLFITTSFSQGDELLVRYRALGLAYMEEDDFPNAVANFEEAVALSKNSTKDHSNLGKSYYHAERFDDAIASLKRALAIDRQNWVALYNLGLVYKTMGKFEEALPCFEAIAKVDESDAALLYNLGLSLVNVGRNADATPWFEKTRALDSTHTSALYQLMLFAARNNQRDKSRELQREFQALKKNEEQRPSEAVDEGVFFGPQEYELSTQSQQRSSGPQTASEFSIQADWSNPLQDIFDITSTRVIAALPDLESKQVDLVIASDGKTHVVRLDAKSEVVSKSLIANDGYNKCFPADYDNDKQIDLLLVSNDKTTLFKKTVSGYEAAEVLPNDTKGVNDAFWADFDHEGDLDLFLARPNDGDIILQNNADGSFTNITSSVQGLKPGNSYSITASDFDHDNDLDIVQLTKEGRLRVFKNLREVRFEKIEDKQLLEPGEDTPSIRCFSFQPDNSKQIVVFHSWLRKQLFRINQDGNVGFHMIEPPDYNALTVFDSNNDGLLDVFFERRGNDRAAISAIHPYPQNGVISKTYFTTQQTNQSVHSAIPIDIDWDGDLDLFVNYENESLVIYENDLKVDNKSILVNVIGEKNSSNGYGSKLLVKDGLFRVYREIQEPVTHIGVGPRDLIDVFRLTWPNGIFQNEIKTAISSPAILNVSEKPGYAGSCPFIYTWDGEKFDFISDALSTGPLGLYVGGGYFPPRPEEYIRIRGDQLKPLNGAFHVRASEELREITYLDRLELLSASHPNAVEIHVNERFTLPPFPEFKLYGMSSQARPIARMVDNFSNNVTELIKENDNRYPRPFDLNTRFEGVDDEYWFEIDLGYFDADQPLMLFMTGYVDWPNSSVARSLEQNPSLDFVMPYLQVKDESGAWVTVKNPMGFPAGKLKTVPLDLTGLFLSDDRSLRIVSTLMVHWDRIWVDPAPITDGFKIRTHHLASADFRYGGYSRMYNLAGVGPHWYDYNQRSDNQRWSFNVGDYTRYGDVGPLLNGFDDRYVIMAPGDEVAAEFDASNFQSAKSLTYFLHLNGWVKDADISTAHSVTVGPLPFIGMGAYPYSDEENYPLSEENLEYLLEYNTRTISDPNEPVRIPSRWNADPPVVESRGLSQR